MEGFLVERFFLRVIHLEAVEFVQKFEIMAASFKIKDLTLPDTVQVTAENEEIDGDDDSEE